MMISLPIKTSVAERWGVSRADDYVPGGVCVGREVKSLCILYHIPLRSKEHRVSVKITR